MSKKTDSSIEIVSFNDLIPELPSLIELDDVALELVAGGTVVCGANCGTYCGTYTKPRAEIEQV